MEICNYQLYNKIPDIKLKGIFNYYENKINLIEFENNKNNEDFEFIINIDSIQLTDEEELDKKKYLDELNEEINRIKKIMEYLVTNIDLLKIQIGNFKIYDYSNVSKHIKNKLKIHNFDLKQFLLKNKIDKIDLTNKIKELLDISDDIQLNEYKLMSSFLLLEIINIYNNYNKLLLYSKQLVEEFPTIIKEKDKKLVKIDKELIMLNNDELSFKFNSNIKNAFTTNNKLGTMINIKKNKDKNFVLLFK